MSRSAPAGATAAPRSCTAAGPTAASASRATAGACSTPRAPILELVEVAGLSAAVQPILHLADGRSHPRVPLSSRAYAPTCKERHQVIRQVSDGPDIGTPPGAAPGRARVVGVADRSAGWLCGGRTASAPPELRWWWPQPGWPRRTQ